MNILVVIEKDTWADFHLAGSLEEMGHSVYRFFYEPSVGEFYGAQRHHELQEKNLTLLEKAKKILHEAGLDLIFCYVYDDLRSVGSFKCIAVTNEKNYKKNAGSFGASRKDTLFPGERK